MLCDPCVCVWCVCHVRMFMLCECMCVVTGIMAHTFKHMKDTLHENTHTYIL